MKLFGRQITLFRPRSIKIRKVVQIFFFVLIGFISINHTLAESGKGYCLSIGRVTARAVPIWRGSNHLPIRHGRHLRAEDPRIVLCADGHRFCAGFVVRPGLLRLGMSPGQRAGILQRHRPQAVQTPVQPHRSGQAGPCAALHPLSRAGLGRLHDRRQRHLDLLEHMTLTLPCSTCGAVNWPSAA